MWLSKLVLNPQVKEVRRDLSNPYEMHRTLSWAVSAGITEGKERLLWRVEPYRPQDYPVVLVQTLTRPDWGAVLDKYPGYAQVDPSSPKAFQPILRPKQLLRFRLKANPSVKRLGKRHALTKYEDKLKWLERRLTAGGYEVVNTVVASEAKIKARKTGAVEPNATPLFITVQAVLFEGVIRVADPYLARQTIASGVGPAKSLGLGLLSVAPLFR